LEEGSKLEGVALIGATTSGKRLVFKGGNQGRLTPRFEIAFLRVWGSSRKKKHPFI